jgi:hypothetical protein
MRKILWLLLIINSALVVGFALDLFYDPDHDALDNWKLVGFWLLSSLAAIWALRHPGKNE